jgi:hypothetical protein
MTAANGSGAARRGNGRLPAGDGPDSGAFKGRAGRSDAGEGVKDPVESAGTILDRKEAFRGTIFDIGPGSAVLTTDGNASLAMGEGLRLRFRLLDPSYLDLFGRIKWIRNAENAQENRKYGVEFPEIGRPEQDAITLYLRETRGVSRKKGLPVEIEEKFKVQHASGRLLIWLNGFLIPSESRQLRLRVQEEVRSAGRAPLLVFLDARRLLACPEESLEEVRDCFAAMKERESFLCIVLVFNPVAMLQIRRIAQLANAGEAFAYFNDARQATACWRKMTKGWGCGPDGFQRAV